jgi:hypothetical protein
VSSRLRLLASIGLSLALHFAFLNYWVGFRTGEQRADFGKSRAYLNAVIAPSVGHFPQDIKQHAGTEPDVTNKRQEIAGVMDPDRGEATFGLPSVEGLPPKVPFALYKSLKELDRPPLPIDIPSLDGPELLGTTKLELVEVRLWINASGRVDKVEAIAGSEVFAAKVQEAFSNARFIPGESENRAVPSVIVIEVEYPEILQ